MKQDDLDLIEFTFEKAFNAGRLWGERYQGWFTPTKKDHVEAMNKAKLEILNKPKPVNP